MGATQGELEVLRGHEVPVERVVSIEAHATVNVLGGSDDVLSYVPRIALGTAGDGDDEQRPTIDYEHALFSSEAARAAGRGDGSDGDGDGDGVGMDVDSDEDGDEEEVD